MKASRLLVTSPAGGFVRVNGSEGGSLGELAVLPKGLGNTMTLKEGPLGPQRLHSSSWRVLVASRGWSGLNRNEFTGTKSFVSQDGFENRVRLGPFPPPLFYF